MKRHKILKMGCGVSNTEDSSLEEGRYQVDLDLKLQACRLTFSHEHFLKLNRKFASLLENDDSEKLMDRQTEYLGAVVERLIQRLICSVGHLDPRFSSKFLINLEPLKNFIYEPRKKLKFKYLVRLDLVSTPALYPQVFEPPVQVVEGTDSKSVPQGFAKIRVHGEFLEQWAGFISSNGYLRRDKIQERFLELLAKAAAKPTEPFSPLQVDESKHCGSPGKIVDPITLHYILKNPPNNQVFFGPDECNESRFPDPRDFRIAMVEEVPEARLHISFLSPTAQSITSDDVEVSILLGIGVCGWPFETNFPSRLPLDHVDFILAYQASQLDYYLVPKGPHPSIACDDRSSVWEIRPLATEMFLDHHYSSVSVVSRVFKTLIYLLEIFKARGMKTINKYILKNLLLFELENKKSIQYWKPKEISKRVLSILDQLLAHLRLQMMPGYIFTKKNLLLEENALEDDFVSDCDILKFFLKQLLNDGFKINADDGECGLIKDDLENILIEKWGNVVASMLPPMSNRGTRLRIVNRTSNFISYTNQQLEYVALLVREILKLKNIQRKGGLRNVERIDERKEESTKKEDFIFLLQIMFDQAKQKLLTSLNSCNRRKLPSRKLLKLDHVLASYDISVAMIMDDIRRSKDMEFNFPDDASVVVKIMECLYKATDADGKILGPVLRPYLRQIFKGSHENCWFLPEWKKRMDLSEFKAIAAFSSLTISKKINPLNGIINSANKGWGWASNCLRIMREIAQLASGVVYSFSNNNMGQICLKPHLDSFKANHDPMFFPEKFTPFQEENSTKIIIGEKADISDSGLRLIFAPAPGVSICFNVSLIKAENMISGKRDSPTKNVMEERVEKSGSDSRYATIKSFQEVLDLALSSNPCEKRQTFSPEVTEMQPVESKKRKCPPHVLLRNNNPFTLAAMEIRRLGNHRGLGSIVQALITLQKLNILQEISQYLPESEKTRVLSDIKKLSKEVQRAAVENYRKKKNFSYFPRNSTFIFKRQKKTFFSWPSSQKRFLEKHLNSYSDPDFGLYKSINEFSPSTEDDEFRKKLKNREKQLDEELKKEKRDSLLGTCRQLRREVRPNICDYQQRCTFPKVGHCRRGTASFPKSLINTPFYIKIATQDDKLSN